MPGVQPRALPILDTRAKDHARPLRRGRRRYGFRCGADGGRRRCTRCAVATNARQAALPQCDRQLVIRDGVQRGDRGGAQADHAG